MSAQSYFDALTRHQSRLEEHGFDYPPGEYELAEAYMDLCDKVDALYAACGMSASYDRHGWRAYPANQSEAVVF